MNADNTQRRDGHADGQTAQKPAVPLGNKAVGGLGSQIAGFPRLCLQCSYGGRESFTVKITDCGNPWPSLPVPPPPPQPPVAHRRPSYSIDTTSPKSCCVGFSSAAFRKPQQPMQRISPCYLYVSLARTYNSERPPPRPQAQPGRRPGRVVTQRRTGGSESMPSVRLAPRLQNCARPPIIPLIR